jgi:TolB-like protein/DNA-binding winged helix-turn-helix (wHTH) protein
MGNPLQTPRVYRFGAFELDARTGELFSHGQKTQLRDQPLQLLLALLANPGELVTREELTRKLWPDDTVVDFDRGLNKAVNKLRDALGDSAGEPQFIETLPRKGYRFIGALNPHGLQQDSPEKLAPLPVRTGEEFRWKWRYAALGLAALLLILGVIASLKMARDHRAPGNGLRPGHLEIDSVAVLPLENLSGDPEQAYFVDGMTDSLITEVARAGTLRVISRTTVLRYKGTRLTTKQIGRELGVDAIVEGTILRSGNKVRITAQLIQVLTDNHLWAQSYERDLTEILELQQKVAGDIARQIGRVVTHVEPIRTVNPEAYGEYLKGRFYFFQYTRDGWRKAIEHFALATENDATFAPAYAGLSESYVVAWGWNALPFENGLQKGKEIAEKALRLDSGLASAHLAMGSVYAQEMDHVNAEKELHRAIELNPNDPLAWQVQGIHKLWQGQFDEGIVDQERAVNLDPFSPIVNANLARAFCFARQYDQAIAQARKTLTLEPGYGVALVWLEHAYRHKGMLKEAYATRLARTKPEEIDAVEKAYRSGGYRGVLLRQSEADKRSGDLGNAARAYAQAGNKEQALASLEECYRRKLTGLGPIKVDADFDPIRADPRYKRLLQRTGYDK